MKKILFMLLAMFIFVATNSFASSDVKNKSGGEYITIQQVDYTQAVVANNIYSLSFSQAVITDNVQYSNKTFAEQSIVYGLERCYKLNSNYTLQQNSLYYTYNNNAIDLNIYKRKINFIQPYLT